MFVTLVLIIMKTYSSLEVKVIVSFKIVIILTKPLEFVIHVCKIIDLPRIMPFVFFQPISKGVR